MLLDKSFGHEFTERPLQAIAERTSEVRSRQSDRTREIAETALWVTLDCSQQLKLQIIQLRISIAGQSVASADECPVSVTLRRSGRRRAQDKLKLGSTPRASQGEPQGRWDSVDSLREFPLAAPTNRTTCPLEEVSRFVDHVKGYRVIANDALLERSKRGEDLTARLQQAANA